MNRFRIGQRLYALIALGGLALVFVSALFLLRLRHDAEALAELKMESRRQDQARVMQVDFKKQVQEWKNILLRGADSTDRARYTAAFRERSAAVRRTGRTLQGTMRDARTRELLGRFLEEHRLLDLQY